MTREQDVCWINTVKRPFASFCLAIHSSTLRVNGYSPLPRVPTVMVVFAITQVLGRVLAYQPMRIKDELLCRALIEVLITLRRVIQRDNLHIDGLRRKSALVQNRHHELSIVIQNRTLS